MKGKFDKFIKDAKRVLIVAKKPSKDEFVRAAKITSIGIAIIGLIGFAIFLGFHFLLG